MATAAQLERPVFLYDGDCSFCSSCADFIERRIPAEADVQAWQFADLGALGVTQGDAEDAVIWIPAAGNGAGGSAETTKAGPEAIVLAAARLVARPGAGAVGGVADLPADLA